MMSLFVGIGIPTRLLGGLIADRVKKQHLRFATAGAYVLMAAALAVLRVSQTLPMIYVFLIVFGIGTGASIGLLQPFRARYFGRKAIGSINGMSSLFMLPLGVIAPVYFGWVYDTTGSYVSAFTVVAGLMALAVVLMSFVVPPKPPARISDVRQIV
jgi:nitrate/nitrite transporter NarK